MAWWIASHQRPVIASVIWPRICLALKIRVLWFCEPFHQWIVEDRFSAGRPSLEQVGVQFVEDVTPYEIMKIRILNGGHALLAYASALLNLEYVHEAMQAPAVRGYLDKVVRSDILPLIPPAQDMDVEAYYEEVVQRFSNPKIGDTVERLCRDGSNRQPKFTLPSLQEALLSLGGRIEGLALGSALWCRYCYGWNEQGEQVKILDPAADQLIEAAQGGTA